MSDQLRRRIATWAVADSAGLAPDGTPIIIGDADGAALLRSMNGWLRSKTKTSA